MASKIQKGFIGTLTSVFRGVSELRAARMSMRRRVFHGLGLVTDDEYERVLDQQAQLEGKIARLEAELEEARRR